MLVKYLINEMPLALNLMCEILQLTKRLRLNDKHRNYHVAYVTGLQPWSWGPPVHAGFYSSLSLNSANNWTNYIIKIWGWNKNQHTQGVPRTRVGNHCSGGMFWVIALLHEVLSNKFRGMVLSERIKKSVDIFLFRMNYSTSVCSSIIN